MPTSVNSLPVLLSAQGRYEKAEHLGLLVAPLCLEQPGQVAHGRERSGAVHPAGPCKSLGLGVKVARPLRSGPLPKAAEPG